MVTSGVCWKQRGDATSRESNKTRRTFRPVYEGDGLVRNLFHVGRHLLRAEHHRELRGRSFLIWDAVTIAA